MVVVSKASSLCNHQRTLISMHCFVQVGGRDAIAILRLLASGLRCETIEKYVRFYMSAPISLVSFPDPLSWWVECSFRWESGYETTISPYPAPVATSTLVTCQQLVLAAVLLYFLLPHTAFSEHSPSSSQPCIRGVS